MNRSRIMNKQRKPLGVFISSRGIFDKSKTSSLLQIRTPYVSMDRRELVEGMHIFEEHFREWVRLACKEWGYSLPNKEYFPSRLTQEVEGRIGKGIIKRLQKLKVLGVGIKYIQLMN